MLGSLTQMPIEVDGHNAVCEECNEIFGVIYFDSLIPQPNCKTCNDIDKPCPECGITGNDIEVKFMCKNCQMKKGLIIQGGAF